MVPILRRLDESGRSFAKIHMKNPNLFAMLLFVATLLCGCDKSRTVDISASDQSISVGDAKAPRSDRKSKVVSVTEAACGKMKSFLKGNQNSYIRLSVKNDGPTGFMYDLKIDDAKPNDSDLVDESNRFMLVTDAKSSLYLDGTTIDWETRDDGSAGFKFNNPNAIEQ